MSTQTRELNFEEGLSEIVRTLEVVEERPVLVAVYGWPGSGKSFLIDKLAEQFEARGLYAANNGGAPSPETFENIQRRGDTNWVNVYLFHCAWNREDEGSLMLSKNEDPNYLARKILGRKLNMNVGIYNPKVEGTRLNGEYDLVISNPNSTRRGLCFKI